MSGADVARGRRDLLTFDFDGVLCRPPFGLNPGNGAGKRRDTPGTKGVLWRTERFRYLGRKPMAGAVQGFRELATRYECHVLTARGEQARGLTESWMRRYLGTVPALHMRPHWRETSAQFKVRMLTELKPLAHFEDDPHTAAWAAEFVPAVFLVDWGRNRALRGERIHRIHAVEGAMPVLADLSARRAESAPRD